MRLYLLLLLFMIPTACNQGSGKPNEDCRTGWAPSPCDEGLRCLDGTCVTCGESGDTCCDDGGLYCPGGTCFGASWSNPGTCGPSTDPGDSGSGSGSGAPPDDVCLNGMFSHTVMVVGQDCLAYPVTFITDTVAQAEECRQKLVEKAAAAGGLEEVCPLDTEPEEPVCKNGTDQLYLPHCSPEKLAACEAFYCPDGCTWSEGACPMSPM